MIIRKLNIKNFGKVHDKTLEFSPGINVLYGENESGKTTIHTFIKSMLFGLTRMRGKAARNDTYNTYEPWENPGVYGGIIWFNSKDHDYRLSRNFQKDHVLAELLNEDTKELADIDEVGLEKIFGNISEAIYDNTVSVAQLKSVTGQDLVRELQNYMASYQGAGDSSIDLGRAMQMLKMSRKGYQVQADRKQKETETEQHGWGRVPFIPLRNNEKELTDLQLVKGLIDAYDLVSSEGTNNLLDLVDLYWVIQGYGGETASAVAKKLQINKAVQISDSSGNVEAKQVQLPVEGRLDWMQMLRKDIFHFGMGVDTDSDDWGKAASGVALKFQYAMFYLKINGIVPEIKRAVKEFFRFATEDWNRENGTDWDWRKIQITLNTNGITDDMETMQIIAASKGMVSEKTLLGKHPFVEDVNSEMEQMERERKEKDNEIDTDD